MTKIPPKPKNYRSTPQNPKNDQNTFETQKMTKIPPKPKNYQNTPETLNEPSYIAPQTKNIIN